MKREEFEKLDAAFLTRFIPMLRDVYCYGKLSEEAHATILTLDYPFPQYIDIIFNRWLADTEVVYL